MKLKREQNNHPKDNNIILYKWHLNIWSKYQTTKRENEQKIKRYKIQMRFYDLLQKKKR